MCHVMEVIFKAQLAFEISCIYLLQGYISRILIARAVPSFQMQDYILWEHPLLGLMCFWLFIVWLLQTRFSHHSHGQNILPTFLSPWNLIQ